MEKCSNVEPISSSRPQQFNYKVLVGMLAVVSSSFIIVVKFYIYVHKRYKTLLKRRENEECF